jgi:hypothetical protein
MTSDESGAIIFIAILAYFLISPTNTIQEKSVYYKYCSDLKHNVFSCHGNTEVMELKYKIFVEKQFVISKGLGGYKSCWVFDKDNWNCTTPAGSSVSMNNGNFYESNDDGSLDEKDQKSVISRYYQIPWFEYYIHSIAAFFRR